MTLWDGTLLDKSRNNIDGGETCEMG